MDNQLQALVEKWRERAASYLRSAGTLESFEPVRDITTATTRAYERMAADRTECADELAALLAQRAQPVTPDERARLHHLLAQAVSLIDPEQHEALTDAIAAELMLCNNGICRPPSAEVQPAPSPQRPKGFPDAEMIKVAVVDLQGPMPLPAWARGDIAHWLEVADRAFSERPTTEDHTP